MYESLSKEALNMTSYFIPVYGLMKLIKDLPEIYNYGVEAAHNKDLGGMFNAALGIGLGVTPAAPIVTSAGVKALNSPIVKTGKSYLNSNYLYLKNTKLKGVPEGGDMELYVPDPVKKNVETYGNATMKLLKDLGVTELPELKFSYENMPLVETQIGHDGILHVGFNSKTLHNPVSYFKVFNELPQLGLNYATIVGHEPAHLMHTVKLNMVRPDGRPYLFEGEPVVKYSGPSDRVIIGEENLYNKEGIFTVDPNSYYQSPLSYLDHGLFAELNIPRKNIMPGLPNTLLSQAHLRAPMEIDADLFSLKNLGHIKNGKVDEEGIKFLMEGHNLSREGVMQTIDDLQLLDYGNAVSGTPINARYKSRVYDAGFATRGRLPSSKNIDLSSAKVVDVGLFSGRLKGVYTLPEVLIPEGYKLIDGFYSGAPFLHTDSYLGKTWLSAEPKVYLAYTRSLYTGKPGYIHSYAIPENTKVLEVDAGGKGWFEFAHDAAKTANQEGYGAIKINNVLEGGDFGYIPTTDFIILDNTPRKIVSVSPGNVKRGTALKPLILSHKHGRKFNYLNLF